MRDDVQASAAGTAIDRVQAQPQRKLFDSHCHIIDHRFPIVPNQGYTPPNFPLEDYLAQVKPLGVVAGAVVSGSFQANDQTYLIDTLPKLGTGWVGVTQIPNDYPDAEIAKLGATVELQHSTTGKGKLVISYHTLDELDGILAHIT